MLSRNYKLQQKQDETNGQATGEAKRFRAQRNRDEEIAPLFVRAINLRNIPPSAELLEGTGRVTFDLRLTTYHRKS